MDITGDGYPEVIVSIFNSSGNPDLNGIYWYENPGSKGGEWLKKVVDPVFSASDIYVGDLNGDGQDDLAASGLFIHKISWFEYRLAEGRVFWTEHVVDPDVNFPGDISVNDFDGDGDMDIVVPVLKDNEMVWYENIASAGEMPDPVLSESGVEKIMEKALDKKLQPVIMLLAEIKQNFEKPRLEKIIAALGYITGLVGIALFLLGRRK